MVRNLFTGLFAGFILAAMAMPAYPQGYGAGAGQQRLQMQDQERIYGSQLMTEEERQAHREMMRSLQSEEERARYRQEHHRKMQDRARELGVALPDQPTPRKGGLPGRSMKKGGRQY